MRFGISTHLYHDRRLSREHLEEVARHGFEAIELFATRTHFDYHDAGAIAALEGWLRDTGLELHGIHAPVATGLTGTTWGPSYSIAAADRGRREEAVREALASLEIARRIPSRVIVVHLGVPAAQNPPATDNSLDAAVRSLEALQEWVPATGARLAVEVIPNALSSPKALVRLLEEGLDGGGAGICLDFGHAALMGDVPDAIEEVAEHLITVHVHDNGGRTDDHLVPFEGSIDWPAALMATQKVGYEGTLLFELANTSTPDDVLRRAQRARRQFEEILGARDQLLEEMRRR